MEKESSTASSWRRQIVTRGPGSELHYDQFNRWAEPLEESFTRSVALNIDSRMEDVIVIIFPSGRLDELDVRVMGRVLRFDADSDGFAVLDVQWILMEKGSDTPSFVRRGHYRGPIAADAGVPGVTAAVEYTTRSIPATAAVRRWRPAAKRASGVSRASNSSHRARYSAAWSAGSRALMTATA